MTQENDVTNPVLKELLVKRGAAHKVRDSASGDSRQADLDVMNFAVKTLMNELRCKTAPKLVLMPLPRGMFMAAAQQGWEDGVSFKGSYELKLHAMLHNLLLERTSLKQTTNHLKTSYCDGFILIEERIVLAHLHFGWLLEMGNEKLGPKMHLDGNVPFIRRFDEHDWGVLFPERFRVDGESTWRRQFNVWRVRDKFQAVKIALELMTQKPDIMAAERYVLPKDVQCAFSGWPVEKMFG